MLEPKCDTHAFFNALSEIIGSDQNQIIVRELATGQLAFSAGIPDFAHLSTASALATSHVDQEQARLSEDAKSLAIKLNVPVVRVMDVNNGAYTKRVSARFVPMRCDACALKCGVLVTFADGNIPQNTPRTTRILRVLPIQV